MRDPPATWLLLQYPTQTYPILKRNSTCWTLLVADGSDKSSISLLSMSHVAHYLAKNTGWVNRSNFYEVDNSPRSKVRAPHSLVTPRIRKKGFFGWLLLVLVLLILWEHIKCEGGNSRTGAGLGKGLAGAIQAIAQACGLFRDPRKGAVWILGGNVRLFLRASLLPWIRLFDSLKSEIKYVIRFQFLNKTKCLYSFSVTHLKTASLVYKKVWICTCICV